MDSTERDSKVQVIKTIRDLSIIAVFVGITYYPEIFPSPVQKYVLYISDFIWWLNDFLISLPTEIYYGISIILILWAGLGYDSPHDNWPVPDGGPPVIAAGIVSSVFLTHSLLVPEMSGFPTIVRSLSSGVVGMFVYLGCLTILHAIVLSICGVDIEVERQKNIDDPYGDKHAARILDEDEN